MDSILFLSGRGVSTIKEISENWLGKAYVLHENREVLTGPVTVRTLVARAGADASKRAY